MDKKAMKAYQQTVYGNPNWVDGRINRLEYFIRILLLYIGLVLTMFFGGILFAFGMRQSNVLAYIIVGFFALVGLLIIWQIVTADVKRLHDLGWSGWLAVLMVLYPIGKHVLSIMFLFNPYLVFDSNFVAFMNVNQILMWVSFILSLILIFKRGTRGVNKYGKDPLVKGEE